MNIIALTRMSLIIVIIMMMSLQACKESSSAEDSQESASTPVLVIPSLGVAPTPTPSSIPSPSTSTEIYDPDMTFATAGNPIIDHIYTADPSAHVWDDRVWLYPSHDQDNATNYGSMNGHHVFSSSDLLNWTDHGEIMHTDNISWARNGYLWAPDAAYKNGIYYYYYPVKTTENAKVIGVATSDSPSGPFIDSGAPIEGSDEIDPAVFIDDDGQAYLYWGGHTLRYVTLNDDMMTHNGVTQLEINNYYEGPWVHKRDDIYYLSYATGTYSSIDYATSESPTGPWTYQGVLMEADVTGGITNHHSIIEFKGQWYIFYHSIALSDHNNRRSVCIDYLHYNSDGTIQTVIQTEGGVVPVLSN